MEKIRVIIADDNKPFCGFLNSYLSQFEDIEVIGIANSDEEELTLINTLKPDIVITDLVRNNKYTGLEIIKNYQKIKDAPDFLVISADNKNSPQFYGIKFSGYIEKPFIDYSIVVYNLRNIMYERIRSKTQLTINGQKKIHKNTFISKILAYFKSKKV